MGQGECKPCSMADPATATVKVDVTLLSQPEAKPPVLEVPEKQAEEVERLRREAAAEQQRLRREVEERSRREQEERQRQEAEARRELELQRERAEAEAQQRRKQEEAEIAEHAAQEVAKERAAAVDAARKAEEARAAAGTEQHEAQKKVDGFLRSRGFKGIAEPRRKCFKTNYPLHAAVEENSAEMVRALLRCGADQSKKDSSGKTPREVAQKCNKKGSHDLVLAAFVVAP